MLFRSENMKGGKIMLNPRYERKETAQCAGCVVVSMLVGFVPDLNFISMACVSNATALLY